MSFAWSRSIGEHPYPRLRSYLESLLERIGFPGEMLEQYAREGTPWVHPGRTVAIARGGPSVGYVGCLHPAVCRDLGVPVSTAIANLDLRALLASGRETRTFEPIPRFPSQPVDVALLVSEDTGVDEVRAFLTEVGKKLVRRVDLFEVYRGEGLPDGKKSLNFTVTLGAADRTLDSKDEEKYLNKVRDRASKVDAELRG